MLLIEGAPHKRWNGRLQVIGGHVEAGEDIAATASREAFEETGITVFPADWSLKGAVHSSNFFGVNAIAFLMAVDIPRTEPRSSSEGVVRWVPCTQLEQLPALLSDLKDLIPAVLGLAPAETLLVNTVFDGQGGVVHSERTVCRGA